MTTTRNATPEKMATSALRDAVEVCNNCKRAHSSKWFRGSNGVRVCRICAPILVRRFGVECQPEAVRIAELVAASPASLRDEVRYLMEDVEHEGEYTEWDALRDLEDRDEPELRTPLRRLLIRLGVYREFTSVDASAIVMGGGRSRSARPDFRLDGKGWTFDRWPDVA